MKIAFYASHVPASAPDPSGDGTQARSLIAALEEEGHLVQVVSEFRASVFWMHWRRLRKLPRAFVKAWRKTREFRPDVWLTLGSERDVPDILGPSVASLARIPYVIYKAPYKSLFGPTLPGRPTSAWGRLPGCLMNRFAIARAANIIANKQVDFELYSRIRKVRAKLSLLLPAVPTTDFKPDKAARARTRLALHVPDDCCVVLSASRLWDRMGRKEKSLRFLIDCMSELLANGNNVHLVVAGDGPNQADIEDYAKKLSSSCTFLARVAAPAMPALYNAGDIFAYPGFGEYIGIVYLEAQACGLPVMAFANGGIPTVVMNNRTGLLTEPMDGKAFVSALKRLIKSPTLRLEMGQAGIDHVRMHHQRSDWGRRIGDVLEIAGGFSKPVG